MTILPMRQMCAVCDQPIVMDFKVPDWLWEEVIHPSMQQSIHCLQCFTRRADEKLTPWHKHIEVLGFYSLAAQARRYNQMSKEWLARMCELESQSESISAGGDPYHAEE